MVTMLAEYGYPQLQHTTTTRIQTDQTPQEQVSLFAEDDTLGTNHLSSEFDEDVNVESNAVDEDDSSIGIFGNDFLTNCLINNLHEIHVQDGVSLNGIDNLDSMLHIPVASNIEIMSDDGSHSNSLSLPSSSSSSPVSQRKRRRNLDNLPWSELSYNERQVLLESISVTVSNVLGPREQLELLRIIDPDVEMLPQDGQFTIEPDFIDNEKLEQIQRLIESNIINNQTPSPDTCTSSSEQRETRGSSPKSSQRKRQSKERRNQIKALRRQQRKEYKQNMKEKRSGLFQKEEVLALQSFTEEEDVDILG